MIPINQIITFFNLFTSPSIQSHNRRLIDDSTSLPLPIDPPSDTFCNTNDLGSDFYYSVFEPCVFTFYNSTTVVNDHHTCNDGVDPSYVVKTEKRYVQLWPESCVATGPRCYSLATNPELFKFTNSDKEKAKEDYIPFPDDAMSVSVSCAADYTKARAFADDLRDNAVSILGPFVTLTVIFVVLALVFCCGGIFCCCCFGRRRVEYVPVAVV